MSNIFYNLDLGTILEITNKKYEIIGYLTCSQNRYLWKEYKLIDEKNNIYWLSVEKNAQIKDVNLYEKVRPYHIDEDGALLENESFLLSDSGIGKVLASVDIENIDINEQFVYKEFISENNPTTILSYEKWEDTEEYSKGISIKKADINIIKLITLTDDEALEHSKITIKDMQNLPLGQNLLVKGKEYTIVGYAWYKQSGFEWLEYKLKAKHSNSRASTVWLCVEQINEDFLLTLHHNIANADVTVWKFDEQVSYKNMIFTKTESGRGIVTSSGGQTDFDYREAFEFIEYETEEGMLLSFEKWSDETEYSFGEEVAKEEFTLLQSKTKNYGPRETRFMKRIFIGIAAFVLILGVIFLPKIFDDLNYPTIESQIKKNTSYKYATSITLTDKKKTKLQVYETSSDTDTTCKEIIDMDPEKIEYVAAADAAEEKFIKTSRESILIYQGEDNKTYVQISKNLSEDSYIGYTPYRAIHSLQVATFLTDSILAEAYANTDGETSSANNSVNTWRYRSYWRSSRDASVTARTSSGGGTSYGK